MSTTPIRGAELSAPRKLMALVPLALSSWLFVVGGFARLMDFALGRTRVAELRLVRHGMLWTSIRLRGNAEQARIETSIPWSRVERSVIRSGHDGLAAPLGLVAFAAGTWLGLSTLVDGLYAASPALVGIAAALVIAGVLFDSLARFAWPSTFQQVFELRTREGLCFRLGGVSEDELKRLCADIEAHVHALQVGDVAASQSGSDAVQS